MIVPDTSLHELGTVVDEARAHLDLDVDDWLARAATALPGVEDDPDLDRPVEVLGPFVTEAGGDVGSPRRAVASAALVAHLALRLADRLPRSGLPTSVLEQYPRCFDRLVTHLRGDDLSGYGPGDDFFLKDVRITGGYSVPCGAQDVDLYGTISRGSGLKSMVTQRDLRNGWRVLRTGGPPWFGIHTDTRHTDDFDEAGWERCYHCIADLLTLRPKAKGMVGTSWFYDPQLVGISPRLAYLQTTPTAHGAFLLRHGPGRIHTERATATSPTRRAMVEAGTYLPVCYSLVWPRDGLLAWSATSRRP